MRIAIRIAWLIVLMATGVAAAIAVATARPGSTKPLGDRSGEPPVATDVSPAEPQRLSHAQTDSPLPLPTGSPAPPSIPPAVAANTPLVMPVQLAASSISGERHDEVVKRLERLEERIERFHEAARQDQLARLEQKLSQIELATRQQQELNSLKHHQHLENAVQQQQQALLMLAQAISNRPDPQPAPPAVAAQPLPNPAPPTPPAEPAPRSVGPDKIKLRQQDEAPLVELNLRGDDLREVLEFLGAEAGLNILALDSVQGTVTASIANVDVHTALEAILKSTGYVARYEGDFVFVGRPEDFQRLDRMNDPVTQRVYRTNYVTAAEVQKLITPLLTPNIGFVTISSPAQVDIPASNEKTGGDSFAGNEVIIVRDHESVLARIDEIIEHVDQRPRQVAIEAMILSVSLDDSHRHGIDFEFLRKRGTITLTTGTPLASLANINVSEGGLHFGFLDSDLGSFIEALETIGDTDVIAAPHLLCLNKQRAEILIGDQKGYLSTTQTETATTQTVEFLDVGTQLRIRPFISDDDMIRLEIHPELSSGDVKLIGTFALPEKSTTQVTTNIMCRNGCTVVIGGLIREDVTTTVTQIPVISNIPVLGKAFQKHIDQVVRSEIIVLITPRIVHDPANCIEGQPCPTELARRQAPMDAKESSISRRFYGRRYLHLAKNAWKADDLAAALDYLDLALEFYPECEEAQQLRDQLLHPAGSLEPTPAEPLGPPAEVAELPMRSASPPLPDGEANPPLPEAEPIPVPPPAESPDVPRRLPSADARPLFAPPPVVAPPAASDRPPDEPPVPPSLDLTDPSDS